jgi:hypothetical protein
MGIGNNAYKDNRRHFPLKGSGDKRVEMRQAIEQSLEKFNHEELRWLNNADLELGLFMRDTGQIEEVGAIR